MSEKNYFSELYSVDVGDKIEQKNGLSYVSWPFAWAEVKKRHPDATYTVYENADGWIYHHDGHTCWVKTGVTVNGIEHIECLPVMDFKNRSIPLDMLTSFEVNKAIQRSLTKACARHGLGLYIYAGEDLPEEPNSKHQPNVPTTPEEDAEQTAKELADLKAKIYAIAAENGIDEEGTNKWAIKQFEKSIDELARYQLVSILKLFETKSKMKAVKKEAVNE